MAMTTYTIRTSGFLLLVLLAVGVAAGQGFSNVGHAGANFLKIPVEPVGAALGNSSVASVQGVAGMYWNPGALATTQGTEVLLSRVNWVGDVSVSYVGVAQQVGQGAFGLSLTALTMEPMEITTETQPDGTGSTFSAGSYAVGVSYAMQIIDRFSFGGSVKYVYEYIWETNGSSFAFDFGSVYRTDLYGMRIGMRLANFGSDVIFAGTPIDRKGDVIAGSGIAYAYDPRLERVSKESPLPQFFNVGISVEPISVDGHALTLTAAITDPNDNDTQYEFGGEYAWADMLFLRGGYKLGFDEQGLSVGIGARTDLAGIRSQLDLAYAAFGRLGSTTFLALRLGL
ncbi:MAG: PorV/PorQ family protein [Bacteroidetes bacterium]|jgi:hypothetical protein|nr:PorV/PorQ family protein [Bacteroidota bacterium]